jgi:hypothetical protein
MKLKASNMMHIKHVTFDFANLLIVVFEILDLVVIVNKYPSKTPVVHCTIQESIDAIERIRKKKEKTA